MDINDPRQALAATAVMEAAFVLLTLLVFFAGVFAARRLGRPAGYSLAPLGFSRPRGGVLAGAMIGVFVGLGAVVMTAVVRLLTIPIFERLGYSTESNIQQPFMEGLQGWVQDSPQFAIPAMIAVIVVTGPFAEELVFRGVIFNGLNRLGRMLFGETGKARKARAWGPFAVAALISSVFFALLHYEPVLLPALTLLALALCALYERTRSLLPCVAAHATFNGVTVLLIILSALGHVPQST